MQKQSAMEAVDASACAEAEAESKAEPGAEAQAEAESQAQANGGGTGAAEDSTTIALKVAHGLRLHHVSVSPHSTFGDLKSLLAPLTHVSPEEQKLLFKGLSKDDSLKIDDAGIKHNSKLILVEARASKQRKLEDSKNNELIARACKEVAHLRAGIDKLAEQVTSLEASIDSGNVVKEKEFALLSELLTQQLLKLDGIDAQGEARVQRKNEVQRVQQYCDIVDRLKAKGSELLLPGDDSSTVSGVADRGDKDDEFS